MRLTIHTSDGQETELQAGDMFFFHSLENHSRGLYFQRDGGILQALIQGEQMEDHIFCWPGTSPYRIRDESSEAQADDGCREIALLVAAAAGFDLKEMGDNVYELVPR